MYGTNRRVAGIGDGLWQGCVFEPVVQQLLFNNGMLIFGL